MRWIGVWNWTPLKDGARDKVINKCLKSPSHACWSCVRSNGSLNITRSLPWWSYIACSCGDRSSLHTSNLCPRAACTQVCLTSRYVRVSEEEVSNNLVIFGTAKRDWHTLLDPAFCRTSESGIPILAIPPSVRRRFLAVSSSAQVRARES